MYFLFILRKRRGFFQGSGANLCGDIVVPTRHSMLSQPLELCSTQKSTSMYEKDQSGDPGVPRGKADCITHV